MPVKNKFLPTTNLATDFTRAIITTRWGANGYRPRTVRTVESYYVDTSLDNDTDPWQIEIGDPNGDLMDTLDRDNEVRCAIFGVGSRANTLPILTGFADNMTFGNEGVLTLTGRDYSAIAVDSTIPPQNYRSKRVWSLVESQAKEIGFHRTRLAHAGPEGNMVRKALYTDGSESYWQFWYRCYRREKMWLWTEPDGTLVGDQLNYDGEPSYYFGTPMKNDPRALWPYYIPVERVEITKTTQNRVGSVWVYGQKGDKPILPAFIDDPTTKGWIKRPRTVMYDAEVNTHRAAVKMAWDEIFEGKVGSLEIALTIADPGFAIEQNEICVLNIPEPGITGEYFVVGVRRQVSQDGFVQEVRLREKQYAISRRVPKEIKPKSLQPVTNDLGAKDFNASLAAQITESPQDWMPYFIKAANKWYGPWSRDLFLATLLGMCEQETGFNNWRSNGHPGGDHVTWYARRTSSTQIVGGVPKHANPLIDQNGRTLSEWQEALRNDFGENGTQWAVGPLQLLSYSLKAQADDMLKQNNHDQFLGGRWVPEYNIMVGAEYLRSNLKQIANDSGRDVDIWLGVLAYEKGVGGGKAWMLANPGQLSPYAKAIKKSVTEGGGYLERVATARTEAADSLKQQQSEPFNPGHKTSTYGGIGPLGAKFNYRDNMGQGPDQKDPSATHYVFAGHWQDHHAIDISCDFGTPVYAVQNGLIGNWGILPGSGFAKSWSTRDKMMADTASNPRYAGNRVNVESPAMSSYYAHLSAVNPLIVKSQASVREGDLLGWSGTANGVNHLHFAVTENKSPYDFIPGAGK